MARKAESNGVKDILQRLFGHDDDRSLLAKLAGREPLKQHRLDPASGSNVFKRSPACDNLIKNLLALDAVFNSQDLICELAEGQVSSAVLHREIERARARLEQKLHAYGYWVDRLNSLEAVLREQPSLEDFALEDRLSVDGQGKMADKGTPYALRAVQLLEKVEEQGRSSLLSSDQLNEKAWALYRLGLSDQAVAAARQAIETDPEHAEAWMLLAICCINEKRAADQEVARYEFQREEADPLSGHERWAEERRDMAEDRRAKALTDHRAVVFPALLYWPRDHENPHRRYRYRENYEQIRNWCIDWLFALTQPDTNCLSTGEDWLRVSEAQGLFPSISWKENPQKHYDRWMRGAGSTRLLSDVETQVAMRICAEWDEWAAKYPSSSPDYYFFQQGGWWKSNKHFTKLKLLHVRSVLGLPGYEAARQSFLTDLREVAGWDRLSVILYQPALLHALTLHGAASGLDELMSYFRGLVDAVAKEQQGKFSLLTGNLLRRVYHQAFARAEFSRCLSVAREAQTFLEQAPGFEPKELGMDEIQGNTLSLKHWKYLELRAALEIAPESVEAQQALLSVAQPARYFADEAAYLIREVVDEFEEDCYVPPYGQSILSSGQWLQAVEALLGAGVYAGPETELRARELIAQLAPLVEENNDTWIIQDDLNAGG